jgi:hypothetical protein
MQWSWPGRALSHSVDKGKLHVSRRRDHQLKRLHFHAIVLPLLLSSVFPMLLSASESQAASYGCYRDGNWKCYPTPQKCYNYGVPPVVRYPSYQACSRKTVTGTDSATAKKSKTARPN